MTGNGSPWTGGQPEADASKVGKAAIRAVRMAAMADLKGSVFSVASEAVPSLARLVASILTVALFLPMLVFTSMPNIFFGYESSETEPVIEMTDKAMVIGETYMGLKDFVMDYIQSFIADLLSTLGAEDIIVGSVSVSGGLDDEDLLWLISIGSVAHEQDLMSMSVEAVQEFCLSQLIVETDLNGFEGEDGLVTYALSVMVDLLGPDLIMDALGFDEDARIWAEALHDTMRDADALSLFREHHEAVRPSHGGDGGYHGDISHGTSYDDTIDISGFVDPDTKNNLDLAAYAIQAWENNWGYVWGTYGQVLTESLFEYKLSQYPEGVGSFKDYIENNWLGRRTTDCVGLIKGYGWLDPSDLKIRYGTNGMPDYGADQMYKAAKAAGTEGTDYGSMSSMPDIVGLAVWKSGHIGIYVGGGRVVEAMNTTTGVVMTQLDGRDWSGWCRLPYIEYLE